MTLRRKVLLIVGVTLAALIAGVYTLSRGILSAGFSRLERNDVERDVERVRNAYADALNNLASKSADWAVWDDAYAFIEDGNERFIHSNCADTTFEDMRLNLMLYVHRSGRIMFAKAFDLREGKEVPVPQSVLQRLQRDDSRLLRYDDVTSKHAGVLLVPEGPMLVVSRPVVTSQREGPIRGTVVFGRWLDAEEVHDLGVRTRLLVTMRRLDGRALSTDLVEARRALAAGAKVVVDPLSSDYIAGYTIVNNIDGRPALLAEVITPRGIFLQAQATMRYLMIALLAVGLAVGILTVVLLERLVLTRVARLASDVVRIGTNTDPSARVSVRGRDELSGLADVINQTLDALRRSQQLLRTTIETTPDCVKLMTEDGTVLEMNPVGLAMVEADSMEEVVGQCVYPIIAPEHREAFRALAERVCRGEKGRLEFEIIGLKGTRRWMETHAVPLRNPVDGSLLQLSVTRDISERKRTEQAIRDAEERYRRLVENLPAITYAAQFGADGKWLYVSPQVESLLGFSVAEWLAEPSLWFSRVHPDDQLAVLAAELRSRESATPLEAEYRMIARDGRVLWFSDRGIVVRDTQGRGDHLQGVMMDITEQKRLEEQFLQSQKVEAVGRLAGGVAHDFNNILTTITGSCELALRKLPPHDPLRKNAQEILKAADRAASLTRQLLAFSRKQTLQPRRIDLSSVVAETDKMLRRLIGEDIQLRTIGRPNAGSVKADPAQIELVLINLAVNARDAMPTGGQLTLSVDRAVVDDDCSPHPNGVPPGDYVLLSVTDTGTGMTDEVKAHIFEPFFTTKPHGQGTGLGLATCYGIVKQSGGHITVDSEYGKGTTFKIFLPRIDAAADRQPARPESLHLPTGTETILVTEDEPAVREFTVGMLRDLGYNVLEAADGLEARRVAEQCNGHGIDLLFTDVVMPQMGGKQLADWMTEARPKTKILFTSGYMADAIVRHGVLEDRIAFLGKPFTPTSLAYKVREVLEK